MHPGSRRHGFPPEADALLPGAQWCLRVCCSRGIWGADASGTRGAHHASCALAAVLQAADVLPGTVGFQPGHKSLQRATIHKFFPMEDVLIQEDPGIPARGAQTCEGCSSSPTPTPRSHSTGASEANPGWHLLLPQMLPKSPCALQNCHPVPCRCKAPPCHLPLGKLLPCLISASPRGPIASIGIYLHTPWPHEKWALSLTLSLL